MITIKHLMDYVGASDGIRVWVEPVGLTKDLQEWCLVDEVVPMLGPPRDLWAWFAAHPDEYDAFRSQYHHWLARGPYRPALLRLAHEAARENCTLLHASDDADHNCAAALKEFIINLGSYCQRDC